MTLEDQVISLSLAKRLKELGVKQDALYWWSEHTVPATLWNEHDLSENDPYAGVSEQSYAAFTVAELGEILPARIEVKDPMIPKFDGTHFASLEVRKHSSWEAVYIIYNRGICYILNGYEKGARFHGTEAEARGLMLEYLLKNNLLTPHTKEQ